MMKQDQGESVELIATYRLWDLHGIDIASSWKDKILNRHAEGSKLVCLLATIYNFLL